jgi:long-chain acyl-CoA synthetase
MLLHQTLENSAATWPDKVALVCGAERFTYGQIDDWANRLACFLRDRGVQRGDRVATFLDNGIEAVVSIYAALKCGAVFMPINPLTRRDKLAYMLNDSRASVLIAHDILASEFVEALSGCPAVHTCIVAGVDKAAPSIVAQLGERGVLYGQAIEAHVAGSRLAPVYPETIDQDLASIIYTSGSTGDPKGVMLTHLNMLSADRSISTYLGLRHDDIIVCVLPLAFDYGLYQVLMSTLVGATVVLETSFAFPVKVLEAMVRERVTVLPGVPTVFSMLMNLKTLPGYDLSALRLMTNTAAALSDEHIRQLRQLFPQATLYSMYGLTECKRVTYLPPEQLDVRPTSVGRGMPNEEVWLVDEEGRRLPYGSTGELVIRGSNVMRGYWEKPEATRERLRPGPMPGEIVLYSGDLFRTDAQGYLYFVARKDDIIKSRGEKVSPREVENILYSLDGVVEAAVIGVDDALLGQAVKAFLVLREGVTYSEREVIRYCLSRMESFMAPKHVQFVPALPKTNTGKIRKTGLA